MKLCLRILIFTYRSLCLTPSYAWEWRDLWSRPDEQAAKLLAKGNVEQAANRFENTEWQGVAYYRSRNFDKAINAFIQDPSSESLYNKGNALARLGQYQKAIDAYEAVLKEDPKNEDARYNRDLLKKMLKKHPQKKMANKENNAGKNSKKKKQQKQTKQQKKNKENRPPKKQKKLAKNTTPEKRREQKAHQRWLRRIPDNPGGLLRQKFLRDHLRMNQSHYRES